MQNKASSQGASARYVPKEPHDARCGKYKGEYVFISHAFMGTAATGGKP